MARDQMPNNTLVSTRKSEALLLVPQRERSASAMRSLTFICRLPIVLVVILSAETRAGDHPVLLEAFSRPVLVGMQLSFKQSLARGQINQDQYECLVDIPTSALHDTVRQLLDNQFTESELTSVELFFSSQAGQRYAKRGLLQIYSDVGVEMPESPPELSPDDYRAIDSFAKTPAGRKLIYEKVIETQSSRDTLSQAILRLIAPCKGAK